MIENSNIISHERFLVHGQQLHDLTDFLYFDKVVYPTTLAYVRPAGMPNSFAGYKLYEEIDRDAQDQLRLAGLISSPGSLLPEVDFLNSSQEEIDNWREEMMRMNENALRILDLPQDRNKHQESYDNFIKEIDLSTRYLANLASMRGNKTVAKYYAQDVDAIFKPGKHSVLSVVFSQLPTLELERVGINDIIDFLSDEETKKKRRRLFDWQNGIENKIEKGDIKLNQVPDRIATLLDDYTTWINASGLSSKISVGEVLLTLGESLIEGLTLVGIPKAVKNILQLGKKKVELQKAELEAPGRELAFIAHCKRHFSTQ